MTTLATVRANALRSLIPRLRLRVVEWIEAEVRAVLTEIGTR